jgi:hypothetical protein
MRIPRLSTTVNFMITTVIFQLHDNPVRSGCNSLRRIFPDDGKSGEANPERISRRYIIGAVRQGFGGKVKERHPGLADSTVLGL